MKLRYDMLPQMRDYDRMSFEWMAYVMYTNSREFRSAACNTDAHGFRYTWRNEDCLDYSVFQDSSGPKGIFCGGSTLFGVGASSDRQTIPSMVNRQSDTTWFNFGVRASNSTQELLLFEFYLPRVENVVLMTGVNNLVAHLRSDHFNPPFGAFVGDDFFYQLAHKSSPSETLRQMMPRRLKGLIPQRVRSQLRTQTKSCQRPSFGQRYHESLTILERDLELWRLLGTAHGFSVWFFLQPFASWTDKTPSAEEEKLFEILDDIGGPDWTMLRDSLTENYERYAIDIADLCARKSIQFSDLNQVMPKEGWLFCDRVHLTDQGNSAVAQTINSMVA